MKVLIITDVQNDFLPGGSLAVKDGDKIIPIINKLLSKFDHVLATQDWHPEDHMSFAPHHGKSPGDVVMLKGIEQILWPIHCVQKTLGAELSKELDQTKIGKIFHKGTDKWVDSYSTFFDNARKRSTGLGEFLKKNNFDNLFFVGLATDYCVKYSVLDALDLGFKTTLIKDACRAINLKEGDEEKALKEMEEKKAKIISSLNLLK